MPRKLLAVILILGFIASSYFFAFSGISQDSEDNTPVFILLGESLNNDYVGECYGNERQNAENICELADDGVLFEQAYAQGVWTPVAVPSLTTARTGKSIGMKNWNYTLSEDVETIFDIYSRKGYKTEVSTVRGGGVHKYNWFGDVEEIENIEGFEEDYSIPSQNQQISLIFWRKEAHTPYAPADEFRKWDNVNMTFEELMDTGPNWHEFKHTIPEEQLKLLYEEEIMMMDNDVGTFVNMLKKEGIYDESLIIFTGDHGEGFGGSQKFANHGGQPYEDVVRVPLVIKFPDQEYAGERVERPVRHVDIPHTIMDYTGVDEDLGTVGQSFRPLFEGSIVPFLGGVYNPVIFSVENSELSWMVREGDFKYILREAGKACEGERSSEEELFNLDNDPKENDNLVDQYPEKADFMREQICRVYSSGDEDLTVHKNIRDKEVEEQLRELGYLS